MRSPRGELQGAVGDRQLQSPVRGNLTGHVIPPTGQGTACLARPPTSGPLSGGSLWLRRRKGLKEVQVGVAGHGAGVASEGGKTHGGEEGVSPMSPLGWMLAAPEGPACSSGTPTTSSFPAIEVDGLGSLSLSCPSCSSGDFA